MCSKKTSNDHWLVHKWSTTGTRKFAAPITEMLLRTLCHESTLLTYMCLALLLSAVEDYQRMEPRRSVRSGTGTGLALLLSSVQAHRDHSPDRLERRSWSPCSRGRAVEVWNSSASLRYPQTVGWISRIGLISATWWIGERYSART